MHEANRPVYDVGRDFSKGHPKMGLNMSAKNNTPKTQECQRHSSPISVLSDQTICFVYPNGEVVVCQSQKKLG